MTSWIERGTARRLAACAVLGAVACGGAGGIDGKYYNTQSGEFAMELKDGKVLSAQGLEGAKLSYKVEGDSVIFDDASTPEPADLVLKIGKNGTLDAGALGTLTRK
jgi:hypothetical protein